MLHQQVTAAQLDEYIKRNSIVLVDFSTNWCAPCKEFSRIFKEMAEQYPHVIFAQIDPEVETELKDIFQVQSVPFLLIFKEERVVYAKPGLLSSSAMKEIIEKVIALDIDTIS